MSGTPESHPVHVQGVLFASIGALCAAQQYLLLWLAVSLNIATAVVASTVGFVTGAVINYVFNYHVTFAARTGHVETVARFVAVAAVGLAINTCLMYLLPEALGMHYLLAQVCTTAAVFVWTFSAHRSWTFRRGEHE